MSMGCGGRGDGRPAAAGGRLPSRADFRRPYLLDDASSAALPPPPPYPSCTTDRMFPAGSLNHAIVGPPFPPPRMMPLASVFRVGWS